MHTQSGLEFGHIPSTKTAFLGLGDILAIDLRFDTIATPRQLSIAFCLPLAAQVAYCRALVLGWFCGP